MITVHGDLAPIALALKHRKKVVATRWELTRLAHNGLQKRPKTRAKLGLEEYHSSLFSTREPYCPT